MAFSTYDNSIASKDEGKLLMNHLSCKENGQNLHMTIASCVGNRTFLHMTEK